MGATIAAPAPKCVDRLEDNEYVIGGYTVRRNFGKRAIYINTAEIASINKGVRYAADRARENNDKQYYVTRIGLRRGNNSQHDIALLFTPLLFLPNVHLPEEYIWEIVNEAHYNQAFASGFNLDQQFALREKWYGLRKKDITTDYSNLFGIFDKKDMNFDNDLVALIAASEAGFSTNGEALNQIRCVLECVFERMIQMGLLSEEDRGQDSKCGQKIRKRKDKSIPAYVKNYIYAILGVVNSGCHAWLKPNITNGQDEADNDPDPTFIKYRNAVNDGQLPYLIRSLVFMLLCVIHWCIGEMEKKGIISE